MFLALLLVPTKAISKEHESATERNEIALNVSFIWQQQQQLWISTLLTHFFKVAQMHFLVTKSIDTDSTSTFTNLELNYGLLASSKCTKCICPTFGQKQHVQIHLCILCKKSLMNSAMCTVECIVNCKVPFSYIITISWLTSWLGIHRGKPCQHIYLWWKKKVSWNTM